MATYNDIPGPALSLHQPRRRRLLGRRRSRLCLALHQGVPQFVGRLAAAIRAACTNAPRVSMAVLCAFESAISLSRRRQGGSLELHRRRHGFLWPTAPHFLRVLRARHSQLLLSGHELRMKGGLPALVPIMRIIAPCREVHGDPVTSGSVE